MIVGGNELGAIDEGFVVVGVGADTTPVNGADDGFVATGFEVCDVVGKSDADTDVGKVGVVLY